MNPDLTFAFQLAVVIPAFATRIALMWENGRTSLRPRRLIPAADAFIVPVNRRIRLLETANPGFAILFAVVVIWTSDIRDRANTIQTTALFLWKFVIVVGLVVEAYLVLIYRRPPIALTPAGIRLKLRTISWDSLDVSMPRAIPASPARKNRSFPELDADPAFVAAVINYYRGNPAARAAIGLPGEYDRVEAALSSPS